MPTAQQFPLAWDLDSLLPHPETDAFAQAFQQLRDDLQKLADRSDALPAIAADSGTVAAWVEFFRESERVSATMISTRAFIGCHAAADAENKSFQRLEGAISALAPLGERVSTNIEFALKAADAATFEQFIRADAVLERIRFYLEERRRNAELRLPREQELLASELAVDGLHAWGRLYDRLSGELRVTVMERGELIEKSPGQVHFDSPQRSVRENNFYATNKAWNRIGDTCADALNHISGTRLSIYRRLGVEDHLVVPLRSNRMERATLDAMWTAVTNRKPMLVKFLQRKAELLGLDKPAWYDLQTPLPGRSAGGEQRLPYDDACRNIIDAFGAFSPELGTFGRHVLENRWIEAENRAGKRQGGFCTGFPTKGESRIFMTYTDSPDSMSTLAHELGHAYHTAVLVDQPLFLRSYPMNLAETASTFAEAVLGERRLRDAASDHERRSILDEMLSDAVVYLMNIHARFIFEDAFHRHRPAGELSAERFSELMVEAQKDAYCGALTDDGYNPSFWISKLHFYITARAFYNFPYTFGYLLSLGLYALAGDAAGDFPARYRELLIATGCKRTEDAVKSTFGYDLSQPHFWNKSLDVVERRVEKFLQLAQ